MEDGFNDSSYDEDIDERLSEEIAEANKSDEEHDEDDVENFYEEIEPITSESQTNFDRLWDLWSNKVMGKYAYDRPLQHRALLEVLLGQLFRNIKITKARIEIDGRISFLHMQNQGSAKNTVFPPFEQIANGLNERLKEIKSNKITTRAKEIVQFTEESTIGSVRVNDEGKAEIIHGEFDKKFNDIILIREAMIVFDEKHKGMVRFINCALDSMWQGNTITKRLASTETPIVCENNLSLILTTFPTLSFTDEVLLSGLFRRFLIYWNDIPLNEQEKATLKSIENFATSRVEKELEDEIFGSDINKIILLLVTAYLPYRNADDIQFKIQDGVIEELQTFSNRIYKLQLTMPSKISDVFQSIKDTYTNFIMVIAAHHALINQGYELANENKEANSGVITLADVKDSIAFVEPLLISAYKFLARTYMVLSDYHEKEELRMENQFLETLVLAFRSSGKVSLKRSDLIGIISKLAQEKGFGFTSYPTILKLLRKAKKNVINYNENERNPIISFKM